MNAFAARSALFAGLFLFILGSASPAEAGFTEVTPSKLKFDGVKYWRKKASEATLGSVGQKMTPVAGKNYFQKQQTPPTGIFSVTIHGAVTISTQKANSWGVQAGYSNVSGRAGGQSGSQGTVTAFRMVIDLGNRPGNLRYETNRHIKHLNALKNLGNRGRLISAVWILISGNETKHECYSGSLQYNDGSLRVKVGARGCKASSYTISPGSILAYEMVKVTKWDKSELKAATSCPSSYPSYEVRKSVLTPKDRCKKTTYSYCGIKCKLMITDKAKNWYVDSRTKRDVCKSKKGKKNKDVKCDKSGHDYVVQDGRDKCRKPSYSYRDPTCPSGYAYNKNSTGNSGRDNCELKGIELLKPDSMDGF